MPIHGRNAKLFVWDAAAACRDVSGDSNDITLNWTRSDVDTTTFGNDTMQRIAGIRDATLSFAALYNGGSPTGIDFVSACLMTASGPQLIKFLPAGCITGCTYYAACMLLDKWDIKAVVTDHVAVTGEFHMASGSVTASQV